MARHNHRLQVIYGCNYSQFLTIGLQPKQLSLSIVSNYALFPFPWSITRVWFKRQSNRNYEIQICPETIYYYHTYPKHIGHSLLISAHKETAIIIGAIVRPHPYTFIVLLAKNLRIQAGECKRTNKRADRCMDITRLIISLLCHIIGYTVYKNQLWRDLFMCNISV